MLKVLIVDDEQIVRDGLIYTFASNKIGIEIIGNADNGVEAVSIIKNKKPDIVITDIRMPGMDGLELAQWIREHYPEIRVIFLTGYSDFNYARNALKLEVSDYLLKPVDKEELFAIIEKIERKLEQENRLRAEQITTNGTLETGIPFSKEMNETGRRSNVIVDKMKEFIENNYMRDIELKTLSNIFFMNPAYLSRIFGSETGITYIDYLTEIRINKAKELLGNTEMSVYSISKMVGYEDEKYFSRIFKKREGISPQEYRKNILK